MQGFADYNSEESLLLLLEDEINNLVLLSLAKQDTNIIISDEEINSIAQEQFSSMIKQSGGRDNLKKIYGTSYENIKGNIYSQVEKMLYINRYSSMFSLGVDVVPNDVIAFYETFKDSLPAIPASYSFSVIEHPYLPNNEDLQKTVSLLTSIKDSIGIDYSLFGSFAKKYSDDPGSKNQGGDLGFVKRGDFVPEYEMAVFDMPIGTISNPIKTDFGYHLIYLIDRTGEKFHSKHILKQNKKTLDGSVYIDVLNNIKESPVLSKNISTIDSIAYSYKKLYKNLSGVYNKTFSDKIPETLISVLKNSKENSFSNVIDLGSSCFVLYFKNYLKERSFDLHNDWAYLKDLTKNKKIEESIIKHINKNKKKVYIKIY